ncbi:DNA repair exonuclease [Annulohypoxylon maeteangense]|uniref:DNA repair exonuclease n=1 Tax=Annulohypoxylon maeteangense TaxID=1927788 RepID=UPI002008DF9D|nr:DNA repair exonuclease [Annulohypoxylon maeteangense]KAI0884651.1 DNA repair exonuclease [Annulohypoxylon maeteangense]
MQVQFTDADEIRILVATDNHVGYEERDPIRGDDSWKSFDEIMNLARTEDVDMVLLAGDLFHDNKPSRKAMYKVMRSLRKNCLGDKPCQLQFLSDATDVFDGGLGHVNYEDPDINISIPVFSIHGNHDDPSGEGNLCSLDLLQMAGLVNYFGRVPQVDEIHAKPVLLQKGLTKLALYGISNVRDERMFRNFRDHNVRWYRPNQQSSDWFNLLAVHQNHHAHTATGYLPENMLPEWLDLVVWGHEHECLIDPSHNPETGFHVMQPGSSVATSLVPGEAVAKHVAILTVTGREFKVEKHRLKSVRPFMTSEIVLANDKRFKGLDKKKENRHDLTKKLIGVVEEMIEEANAEWDSIQEEDSLDNTRPLPLIRLKVEYTAPEGGQYDIENPQRFSNRFQGKVANTNDVVHFYRKKTVQRKAPMGELPEELLANLEEIDDIKVDKLVAEFLSAQAQSLKILPQAPFGDAVNQFVDKEDKHAMESFVSESLTEQVKQMLSLGDDDDLENAMEQVKARLEQKFSAGTLKQAQRRFYKPRPPRYDSDIDGPWEDQPQALDHEAMAADAAKSQPSQPAPKPKGRGRKAVPVVEEDEDMDDVFEEPAPKPKGRVRPAAAAKPKVAAKAPAKKAPARGRGKKQVFDQSDEEEEDADPDVVMDDDEYDPPPPPPPKRAPVARATRAAPARSQGSRAASSAAKSASSGAKTTRQTKLNFGSQKATQEEPLEISDDEISDDFEAVPIARSRRR